MSRQPATHLISVQYREGESLKEYIAHLDHEAMQVYGYTNVMAHLCSDCKNIH